MDLNKRIDILKQNFYIKRNSTIKQKLSAFYIIVDLISGMVVGCVSGYSLDQYFQTLPAFLFVFSGLGTIAGLYNALKNVSKS